MLKQRIHTKQVSYQTIIRHWGMISLVFIVALLNFSGCQYAQQPKADVDFYHVGVDITNHNNFTWEGCDATLNTESDKENQYTLHIGSVQAGESITVITTKFSKDDGKRFIPVVTVAKDIQIQCKKPLRPFHQFL